MSNEEVNRIDVSFGVDVPTEELAKIEKRTEMVRPASVELSALYDERKALYNQFMARLEGECAAYMNIAKSQARQIFGM